MEDGHHMEENIAKFGEKLKQLVAHGKKNKSILELQEINDFLYLLISIFTAIIKPYSPNSN